MLPNPHYEAALRPLTGRDVPVADWLAQHGLTPLQACLRYPLSLPHIDKVLIGVDNTMHLRQILDAADGTLPPPPDWPLPLDPELLLPSLWN
jgi:aryl-alcohol dehydrogenase-like predicted oxidoreductase